MDLQKFTERQEWQTTVAKISVNYKYPYGSL